jgi:hypothetical protein
MNDHEIQLVKKEAPALAMFMAIAEGCAKVATLTPTFASLLLSQMTSGVNAPLRGLDERRFGRISANYTARGCEAVFKDTENGQKYHVAVEPINEKGV